MPARIVISYARADGQVAADEVAQLLRDNGQEFAQDHFDLTGGEPWRAQFRRLIQGGEHLVLVLSPAALASDACRWEWECARESGLQISPVRAGDKLDVARLAPWMREAHRYNLGIEGQRRNFLRVLEGPAARWRVPFMAPFASARFVDRPVPLGDARQLLLSSAEGGPMVALRGAGGFGKSSLAVQLAEDDLVRDQFFDGVLWVTFGKDPVDPIPKLADLVEKVRGTRPGFTTLEAAREEFVKELDNRRCLLVLDDVWRRADITPFLAGRSSDRTARLITTRDHAVLPEGASVIRVAEMENSEALQVLSRDLPTTRATGPSLEALATRRLGGWPLLLALGNSILRDRVRRGQDLGAAISWLEEALARRGAAGALASGTAGDYQRGVAETLAISMESLTPEQRACAEVLCAMAQDSVMTLASAARLWGVDTFDAEDIASTLDDRSLISRLDLGAGSFELHVRLRDVLAARAGPERLRDAQARLVAGWRAETGGHWELLRDSYALEHLPSHLRAMGDADGLAALLLDPAWMTAKLRGLGVQRLLADYRAHAPDRGSALGLVRQALHLAAPALAVAPEELPAQLLGRLAEEDGPEIAALRQQARRLAPRGSLLPLRRSLTGPGAELMRLLGHEGRVRSVGFSPDGARLVSGSGDNTLRLWDAASGALLASLRGHEADVNSVSFSPDGARLVSGSYDGTLRLWDAASGALLASLRGHDDYVFSVCFSPDGARLVSGSYDGTLRLWDAANGALLATLTGHQVFSVCFSPDGARLVSGGRDGTLRLWDAASGALLASLRGHEGDVNSVSFSPDGARLVSGGDDRTLRLWDADTGQPISRLTCDAAILAVACGPGGRIAAGDRLGRLHFLTIHD